MPKYVLCTPRGIAFEVSQAMADNITDTDIADSGAQLTQHLRGLSQNRCIPPDHVRYLHNLKQTGFEPAVIYDIGACLLQWTREAREVWPQARIIAFDAFDHAEFLYKEAGMDYHVGVLSDVCKMVKFYQNDHMPGGNSYYRERSSVFPRDRFHIRTTRTLDSVVHERGFPLPDLVKLDVQGSELDILRGARRTLHNAQHLIVELQHTDYNEGAPHAVDSVPAIESMGWRCVAPLFQNNGPDGDYGFVRFAG